MATSAHAGTVYDTALANPGVYYGAGNSGLNTGWATNTSGGVELGLSTNYRYIGQVAPVAGTNTYHVNTGYFAGPGSCIGVCSLWNFEFSVNLGSSGLNLSGVSTSLSIFDVANATTVTFDPFNALPDNSAFDGTNTRNGNTSGDQAIGSDVGFQNSENLAYILGLFDPTADDTYIVTLELTDPSGLNLSVDKTVIAGAGATPLPPALPLFASGLGAMGLLGWRRKKKARALAAA